MFNWNSTYTLVCLINVEFQINVEGGRAMNVEGKNPPTLLCPINLEGQRLNSVEGGRII